MTDLTLPPLGTVGPDDHGTVATYLSNLAREAAEARDEWADLADDNLEIFHYGEKGYNDGGERVVHNSIQNAIVTATDIQTKEPPRATLEPIETGEPPQSFWAGPDIVGLAVFKLPPEQVTAFRTPVLDETGQPVVSPDGQPVLGDLQPPMPIDPLWADGIRAMLSTGTPVTLPMVPFPVPLKPEWMVDIDDRFVAENYQKLFDVDWQTISMDRRLRENLLTTNAQGWTWALYEYDVDLKRHIVRPLSIRQVFVDPTVSDIEDATYAGVDLVIDADEAKGLYPHLAEQIDAWSQTGQPVRPDTNTQFGQSADRSFERATVTMRVFWLRNQPYDPVSAGMADGTLTMGPDGGFVDAETGEPVDPNAADWQPRRVIRQLTQIEREIVDDRECPHFDIPLLHNVCIPVLNTPFGLGEPFRLKKLQKADCDILTALVEHSQFYKSPVNAMSRSMADALTATYGDAYVRPGRTLIVPDELYERFGGKVNSIVDPPATPQGLVQLEGIVQGKISEGSGNTDVVRGVAPGSDTSGKAIEHLQQGAVSLIGFKSQRTADVVRRLTRLMHHSNVKWLTPEDIRRVISRYPLHIIAAMLERGKRLRWDTKVTVESGSGNMIAAKKAQALQEFGVRDPVTGKPLISLETTRERLQIDHHQEERRLQAEMMNMARNSGMLAGGGTGGPEGGGGGDGKPAESPTPRGSKPGEAA